MGGMPMPSGAPTPAERAAADRLVAETRADAARFADPTVAAAEGYVQLTPFWFDGVRAAHFHNQRYADDGRVLDPEHPEDLLYLKTYDGRLVLIGVMYLAPIGQGPRIGGPLTTWHTHDELCVAPAGIAARGPDGGCPAGTGPIPFEMMHVWLVANPNGAFAHDLPPASVAGLMAQAPAGPVAAYGGVLDGGAIFRDIAGALNLNVLQLRQRFAAGQSLTEIAAARGVDRRTLVLAVERSVAAALGRAVAAGDMTPAQRDLLIRSMPPHVERLVDARRSDRHG